MRFAIYYAPPPSSLLSNIGCKWFGCNSFSGEKGNTDLPTTLSTQRFEELMRAPRHYGLHGTLKAPFRLAGHHSEEELHSSISNFVARQHPFMTPSLRLHLINDFFCLCPEKRSVEMDNLAAACVQTLDEFRAPLNQTEFDRRKKDNLSGDEKRNLFTWGYPYVMEQFRFHITLTGRIADDSEKEVLHAVLSDTFAPISGKPLAVDGICLFIEPSPGEPFYLRKYYPFNP